MANLWQPIRRVFPVSSDGAVKVHKFLDGGKVHLVRNKTFKGKPRLVKPVCGGAQMKYSVKHPVHSLYKKKEKKDQTKNKKKSIQRYQTSSPVVILSPLLQLMCYLICRRERVTGSRMFLAPDHHDNSHNKFSLFTFFLLSRLSLFFFFFFFHSNILMSTRRCCIIIWHLCNE